MPDISTAFAHCAQALVPPPTDIRTRSTRLMFGDCLERMREIPDGSIDLILCDLPYGTTQNKWDSIIPLDKLWDAYWRVCKPNAAVVLTATQPFSSQLGASCLALLRYSWVWVKPHTGQLNAKRMPLKNAEDVLVFYRAAPTYNPQWSYGRPYRAERKGYKGNSSYGAQSDHTAVSDGRRYPTQTICFNRDKNLEHPTQKPVALMEYLVRTYSNVGETILDNTMGSGTTGVACVNTGRKFVGIEQDAQYFAVAERRIREAEASTPETDIFS